MTNTAAGNRKRLWSYMSVLRKNVLNYFCEESNAESLILINFMSIEIC